MRDYSTIAINVENLSKSYNGTHVLDNVNLQIEKGEFYVLMGPNGSGKSTLLSIIAGTNPYDSGSVNIFGSDICGKKLEARGHIGYVPQQNFCSAFLTGRENLQYFAKLLGLDHSEARKQITDLLEMMQLTEDADRRVADYSGGMKKKLEIATSLLGKTEILLLDEPTTGLDPGVRKEFLKLLSEINRQGRTILLVSHIGEDAELATRVAFMVKGEIIIEDGPEELKEKSGVHSSIVVDATPRNQELLLLLASLDDNCIVTEEEDGFRISCDRPMKLIPVIMKTLEKAGYNILSIDTHPPTLEDVFYRMTSLSIRGGVQ